MILYLTGPWAVAIDFAIWLVVHVAGSVSVSRLNPTSFDPRSWLYRARSWERSGQIYQDVFRIRRWKGLLPDGAAVSKSGFRKKHLSSSDIPYIQRFVLETCRAELTHWVILVFAPLFFLWNDWRVGVVMIIYGVAANAPCIMAQRYNRVRLERILEDGQ